MSGKPRRCCSKVFTSVAVIWLSLTRADAAEASPLLELVGAGVGLGGFNARVTGASSASTYFNPALLSQANEGVELGWFVLNDAISVALEGRDPRVDVPESSVERTGTELPPLPTAWLEQGCDPASGDECVTALEPRPRQSAGTSGNTQLYQVLGLVSHLVPRFLSVGVYAMVPFGSVTQTQSFFVDEREQYFSNSLHPELYGDRLTPVSAVFGAASQPLDWLSVGLSLSLSLKTNAQANTYVGNSANLSDTLQVANNVDVIARFSPHFGVLIEPSEPLDITLALHTPQKMTVGTALSTFLPNGDLQQAQRLATHSWLPLIATAGASYQLLQTPTGILEVVSSVGFERWSEYVNRQGERPAADRAWKDVFLGSVGARYQHAKRLNLSLDAKFRPSPVPPQTGRENYVDNDRLSIAAGVSLDVSIQDSGPMLRFGAHGQLHFLTERSQQKLDPLSRGTEQSLVLDEWPDDVVDISTGEVIAEAQGLQTNNPGWPGFSSRGVLVGGGVTISLFY